MSRFPSLKYNPSETRRLLRDRFDQKLRVFRQRHRAHATAEAIPDESMLRLLQNLEITFEAERTRAEAIYAAANPSSTEPSNLTAAIDAGWARVIWGRAAINPHVGHTIRQAAVGSMDALKTLLNQIHGKTLRTTQTLKSDRALASIVSSIEAGQEDLSSLACQTPSWVAGRLWEEAVVGESELIRLRRWIDRWVILQYPDLAPGDTWIPSEAEAFRSAGVSVLTSGMGLYHWQDLRVTAITALALAQGVPVEKIESHILEMPSTIVNRALWLEQPMLQDMLADTNFCCDEVHGLVRILLADVIADYNSSAVHPIAAKLIELAADRPELFLFVVHEVRAHPILLADLLLHPATTALACLLVAQWRAPRTGWDRGLVERDDRLGQTEAFADAAAVLGEFLKSKKIPPAEVAALLNWFHKNARPGFIDDAGGDEVLLATLRREIIGVAKSTLLAMAQSLHGPGLQRGLGASEFASVLDLVEVGGLSADLEATAIVEAYAQSIRTGGYDLSAHRVSTASAAALFRLASRNPTLREKFLNPLDMNARLAAAEADQNRYAGIESVARSLRAHIRILCRAIIGMRENIPDDLVDALVDAVESGALDHREKGRIGAFAPRFEHNVLGPVLDRPLAADLGATLSVLDGSRRTRLLRAVLDTDEPLILTQILSFGPPAMRVRIEERISAIAPAKAGVIQSLPEMQARIDELLTVGAVDAAERYMEAEEKLKTVGKIPGHESTRFRNRLRLHYLRGDWPAIASAAKPVCQMPFDQTLVEETLNFFQGIAAARGPNANYEQAKGIFLELFNKRPTLAHASNWFAVECSRLLNSDNFRLLKETEVQEGRQALIEIERMLASIQSGQTLDEVTECNKALLLLALGEPSQALAILTSVPLVRLQTTAAAYRAVALSRLGRRPEAIAVLDEAEHAYGATEITAAAHQYIATASTSWSAIEFSLEDGPYKELVPAIARFRRMNPIDQARVLDPRSDAFEALAIDYVRAAADSLISLVPMMKSVVIDTVEDDLTAFIQHLLGAQVNFLGWSVADQSKGGFTAKGNPGERDLMLMWGNTILALIEAVIWNKPLSHDSVRADLESHFQKLLGYGNPRLFFHVTYSYGDDPASVMRFLETVSESAQPPGFIFKGREEIRQTDSRPPGFVARYETGSGEVKVIFLVLNLGQYRQREAAKVAEATKTRKAPKRNQKKATNSKKS